ncbi:Fumarate reductase flavoprotein subunit [Halioglobus japonicus]|nr:Fumarate reductase flavoprotein subunit [Halioglobus japonicus]
MTDTQSYESSIDAASVDSWHSETDVLIVGGGGAGICAAIEAADAGARVTVLEAASEAGGSTAMAGGLIYMGGGTPTQQACGFDDDIEEMHKYLMLASGPNADPAKVRLYCDRTLEHYDWLTGQGVQFKPEYYPHKHTNTPNEAALMITGNEEAWPYSEASKAAPRGHKPQIKGDHGGIPLMENLLRSAREKGVQILCEARALTAIKSGDEVVGIAARIDMQVQYIRAHRGVVLAGGGFIMNREMLETYAPRLALGNYPNGNPNDTGDGIRIGMAAGGMAINMDEGFICTPFYPPHQFLEAIIVDETGMRFINEDVYHGRLGSAILDRPDGRYYLIIDSRHFEVLESPPMGGYPVAGTGENLEELERELDLPPGALTRTLDTYNRHASNGEDPVCHKHEKYLTPLDRPPYAAFDLTPGNGAIFATMTFGGLDTQPTGEVLDKNRSVIPGLYAAGRNSAGLPRCAEGYSSGMSIGDATFFGRLAGLSAASRG